MPPAETPDFDSMSPEELMAWMESLAKRQGASEGFTTAADMQIEEIDPSTVHVDEPGYVPFGEESSRKASPPPAATTEPAPAPPEPAPPAPLELPAEDEQETQPAVELGGMAWLESLAADQSDFPDLDLSSLSAAIESESSLPEAETSNPMDWLQSMASEQDAAALETVSAVQQTPSPADDDDELAGIEDPLAAGVDPMAWLESLARRQGAKDEELTTSATRQIRPPEPAQPAPPPPTPEPSVDPAAWLESLASGDSLDDADEAEEAEAVIGHMSDEDIRAALAQGAAIPHDEMEAFLGRQLDRQLEGGEIPLPQMDYDPDAPAEPAQLPDWLLEQVQPPAEELEAVDEASQPALLDEIIEPPEVQDLDLPDWLREDVEPETPEGLEDIFAAEDEPAPVSLFEIDEPDEADTPTELLPVLEIDGNDPWVVAFDEEQQADPDEIPEWYQRNLNDPQRIAAVEQQLGVEGHAAEDEALAESALEPEDDLAPGELEPSVPDWLSEVTVSGEVEEIADVPDWLQAGVPDDAPAEPAEIPDWLQMAEVDVDSTEIPDWLRETVAESAPDEPEPLPEPEPAAPPAPVAAAPIPAPQPQAVSPAPVPAAVAIDVEATLAQARRQIGGGNVAGGLIEYESIIRANQALDVVVADLTKLVEENEDNPAVYRVLGDGLMRQGKLQSALDTYRMALNQL